MNEDSKTLLTVETSDELCKLIAKGEKPISYLAEKMQILYRDNSVKQF